jgi:hypothetical protein
MDVVTAVRSDHRTLVALFEQVSEEGNRTGLLAEVRARLTAYFQAEQLHIHPALKRIGHPNLTAEAQRTVQDRLSDAENAPAERFPDAFAELVRVVTQHMLTVESEILPALSAALPGRRRDELGRRFESQRIQLLRRAGIDDTLTREDLYIRAQKAGIPGRSSMSKGELIRALLRKEAD